MSSDDGGSTPGIEEQSAARRVLGVESVVISGAAMGTSSQSMRLSLRTLVSGAFDGAARSYPYSEQRAGRFEHVVAKRQAVGGD
jgi:hypothetical protein